MDDPAFGRLTTALHEAETARDESRAALRSIASALGMSADALPGAIVERVEELAGDYRYATGLGAVAEAIAMLGDQARDSEGVIDTVRRLIESQARPASPRMLAAIQGQARDGELPDQTVERLIRERDESRARLAFCDRTLDDVCRALGLNVDETSRGDMLRKIERLTSARAEAERLRGEGDDIEAELLEVFGEHRADDSTISKVRTLITWHHEEVDFIGQIEPLLGLDGDPGQIPDAIRKLIEERGHLRVTVQTAIPAIRAGINALGSSEENVQQRNAARDAVRALEAAAEDQAAPAAVLSAAERKAVEALRRWRELPDERIGDPFAAEWLDVLEAADAVIEAGRPLASKEGA